MALKFSGWAAKLFNWEIRTVAILVFFKKKETWGGCV